MPEIWIFLNLDEQIKRYEIIKFRVLIAKEMIFYKFNGHVAPPGSLVPVRLSDLTRSFWSEVVHGAYP